MKTSLLYITVSLMLLLSLGMTSSKEKEIQSKVKDLLSKMTLEEKVGQMTQVTIQAVSTQPGNVNQKHLAG